MNTVLLTLALKEEERIRRKKLVRRVEPTKQYTKSQNKYAPATKQLKIKGVKYPTEQSNYRRGIRNLKNNCHFCIHHSSIA